MKYSHFILILIIGFSFAQNYEDTEEIHICSGISIDVGSLITRG